jgi:branched-chain amino acid transport system substrate-binding protein
MTVHARASWRKGLVVGVAVLGVVSIAACERKGARSGSDTGDIRVGLYASLTGDGASFGQSSREGSELAVREINAAGGLLDGRKIDLLVEDDQSQPSDASNAATKLITQDQVVALIGEVASSRSLAVAPVAQRYHVPMITPASTNERVTEAGD